MIRAKVCLVHPSNRNVYRGFEDGAPHSVLPIGLLYVAAVLEGRGHDVTVVDAEAEGLSLEETGSRIMKSCPDVVGFSVTTPIWSEASKLAWGCKKTLPRIVTVMGGPHVSAVPYEVAGLRYVDVAVVGEGEAAMCMVADAYERDGSAELPSIIRPPVEPGALDDLSFPARHLVNNSLYRSLYSGEPYTLMVSSRGCPYSCIFCASRVTFGGKPRFRSVENVARELVEVVEYYGIHDVVFSDDTFTLDKKRTIELCRVIKDLKLDLRFKVASRVDKVDREILHCLREAGCWQVSFGVESASQTTLDFLKKGITLDQSRGAVKLAKEAGLGTYASYILGVQGETLNDVEKTISFANELDTDYAQFTIATPLPGTEMWDLAFPEGTKPPRYDDVMFYYSPTIEGLDRDWLVERQRKAYKDYKERKEK
jgi:anaerobic magnesium-protoporphyrin IX monomethyl ester cyclase